MGSGVFVTYAREDGPDDAQRLVGVLERILGPDSLTLAAPAGDARAGHEAIERCEVVVALIGPAWRAADDELTADLADAFAHRIPVIAMLVRRAPMPSRDALPPALGPLLDNHPRLTLEMPSEFYWDVTTSHLGRWLLAIRDENRRLERARSAAVETTQKLRRELQRTTERLSEAESAAAAADRRRATAEAALAGAAQMLEQRRRELGPARSGPGLRVFICYRPETGGDVRTLERDLRERLDGCRLSSSEPIPDNADAAAIADQRVARADAVLAIVGPRWAGGAAGEPSLENADDPVRLELEAALARGLPVVSVLTQHAPQPAAEALPQSLRQLAGEHAYELIVAFWKDGVADLVERLETIESDLRRREKALADATQRQRRLERDQEGARADEAKAAAAIRAARERIAALEEGLRRAGEEDERLRHEHRDANRAYVDGPGPITLEGGRDDRRERRDDDDRPRRAQPPARLLIGAFGLLVIVIIIIAISH